MILAMNNTHNPEDELLPEYDFDYNQAYSNRFAKEHQKLLQRNNQLFDPPIEDYLYITREERNAQQDELMNELFGGSDDNSLI